MPKYSYKNLVWTLIQYCWNAQQNNLSFHFSRRVPHPRVLEQERRELVVPHAADRPDAKGHSRRHPQAWVVPEGPAAVPLPRLQFYILFCTYRQDPHNRHLNNITDKYKHFKWDLKSGSPAIWNLDKWPPFFKKYVKSGQKHQDFEWFGFQMVGTIAIAWAFENNTIWNPIFKSSRFQIPDAKLCHFN